MKADFWGPLAAELGVPARAAEDMHWDLGKENMASRAGVRPFSTSVPPSQVFPPAPYLHHGHSPLNFAQVPGNGQTTPMTFPQPSYSAGVVAGSTSLPSPGYRGPRDQSVDPMQAQGRLSPHQHPLSQQQYPFPNVGSAAAYRRPSDPGLAPFGFGRGTRQASASTPGAIVGSVSDSEVTTETLPALGSGTLRPPTPDGTEQGRSGSLPSLAEVVSGVPAPSYAGFVGGPPIERVPQELRKEEQIADEKSSEQPQSTEQEVRRQEQVRRQGVQHLECEEEAKK